MTGRVQGNVALVTGAERQVEALDRRAVDVVAHVRSQEQLDAAVTRGIAEPALHLDSHLAAPVR